MFEKIDDWLFRMADEGGVSLNPSGSRWNIFQFLVSASLFAGGVSISFFALAVSLWGINMLIAILFAVLALVVFLVSVFGFCYAVHLSHKWRSEGSKDDTATNSSVMHLGNKIDSRLTSIESELRTLSNNVVVALRGEQDDKPKQ